MESWKLVMPPHLNHHGFLFGGILLQWVDELAYIIAVREFPGRRFVTVAMDDVVFRASVTQGAILRLEAVRQHLGTTSVRYAVCVFRDSIDSGEEALVFETSVTLVNVNEAGKKHPI